MPASARLRAINSPEHRSSSVSRYVSLLTVVIVVVCAFAITAFGGTYALLNSASTVNAGTITSGTLTMRIDRSALAFGGLPLAAGQSGVAPAVVTNTGNVALTVRVSGTTVTSDTKGMAAQSRLGVAAVASTAACTTAAVADPTTALSGFSTSATTPLVILQPGTSSVLCFELKLDSAAPTSVQGGATAFAVTVQGNQVAAQ